jgi:biopolymer transport protein ExbD
MAAGPQNEDGDTLSEVNVIPLADLSLTLLIILMVISPMIMQSMIKVVASHATASKGAQDQKEPPLIVLLNADGSVWLNSVKVTDLDLATKVETAFSNRTEKSILVTVDPQAAHGRFVQVLDILKQHGAEKINLLKKAGGASARAAAPKK